jgi:VWFA-related protein
MGKHLLTSVNWDQSKSGSRAWFHSSYQDERRLPVSLQRDFAMRKLALLLLLAGIALPAVAARNITVEQLQQVLAAAHGKTDAKVALQLTDLQLTERLSAAKLSLWEADLPGPESRRSLVLLADVAAFLDPPAAEIPATPAPDFAAQRRVIALTVDYASKTLRQLPNFFATRDTVRFEDTPQGFRTDTSEIPYQPLHPVGRSTDTVLYRDGNEVVDSRAAKGNKNQPATQGLTTTGVFGPVLATVLVDAAQGKLAWTHWEQGTAGPLAVFRFAVPREKSHYQVEFCCVAADNGGYRVFQQFSGYHGEMAVDPANGAILRLTLEADLKPADKIVRSDILVEYGPVEIGGKTYICPLKSVSISDAPALGSNAFELQRYRGGALLEHDSHTAPMHLRAMLNDVVFEQYHLFHANARMLAGSNGATVENAASGLTEAGPAHEENAEPPEAVPVENAAAGVPTASSPAVAPASAETTHSREENPAAAPVAPEISVAGVAELPDTPTTAGPATPGSPLRVTARLVDISVVAYDKKGHPVTNLKPEDFEIFDNGRKQEVRFFSRAGGAPGEESAKVPDRVPDRTTVSNRRPAADAKPDIGGTEDNTTILFIDSSNLAWADLTHARGEILRFLQALPPNERVGLYVVKSNGMQVLEEGTADHAMLSAKLSQWMPSAKDLARAQEEERRNRQQFDEVLHPEDLQYVNGKSGSGPDKAEPVDPKLRDFGSNPAREALSILVAVARHLAAIQGHKNLVWVSSDNVLADWTDKAVSSDKGSKHIEGFVLRAQEAMNDAHVSIYPLDASQLETQAIDPSLKNRNIELASGVLGPPPPQGGGAAAGRITAEMIQDLHPIQAPLQEMAHATGGRAIPRAGDMAAALNSVVEDGRATYLLSFSPDVAADDQYHLLTLKLPARRGVSLRYRAGYQYATEPTTLKDRLRQAIWQSFDVTEIAVSAQAVPASTGTIVKLNIATNDLALRQQGDRWMDKLDIFLIQRDDDGLHARVTGQTLGLALKPVTYQRALEGGIPFDQLVAKKEDAGTIRIVVVDENSGRMGSATAPATVLKERH